MPGFTPNLPRGKSRSTLVKGGRQKTPQFKRSTTSLQVKNKILQEFKGIDDDLIGFTVMESKANHLIVSKTQCPDGEDVINRKGALYLCQKSSQVHSHNYIYMIYIVIVTSLAFMFQI